MSDPIDRQDAIRIVDGIDTWQAGWRGDAIESLKALPSAQPERLTDDDFETIRIHLSAYKERLCNQHRWKEAEEYQKIINRLRSFASAQPEPCEVAVSAMAVEEMLKNLLPERGMWEIEGDDAKTAICETIHDALEGLWKLPFVKPDSNKSSVTQKALDTISRQAAIDALNGQISVTGDINAKAVQNYIRMVNQRLHDLPSVQPEPIWGLPVSTDRPLADVEIVPRLRDIQKQIPGGSYAIDRAIEIIEAVAERRTDGF